MADVKKPYFKPQVADSSISDVFEGRHPSDAEKAWAKLQTQLAELKSNGVEQQQAAAAAVEATGTP